jgi:hypothetical protein
MNAGMERLMNSKNLGARNAENGALDQKIWALECLEWLEGLDAKRQGLM